MANALLMQKSFQNVNEVITPDFVENKTTVNSRRGSSEWGSQFEYSTVRTWYPNVDKITYDTMAIFYCGVKLTLLKSENQAGGMLEFTPQIVMSQNQYAASVNPTTKTINNDYKTKEIIRVSDSEIRFRDTNTTLQNNRIVATLIFSPMTADEAYAQIQVETSVIIWILPILK